MPSCFVARTLCLVLVAPCCSAPWAQALHKGQDGPLTAPRSAFSGTAYAKTRLTAWVSGPQLGPVQAAGQALVEQCNALRTSRYALPPNAPAPELMAQLDVRIQEKFFDTDKALTLLTAQRLMLPDLSRWYTDEDALRKKGISAPPDTPPDCSHTKVPEIKTGVLWRDGLRHELRFVARKAEATRIPAAEAMRALTTTAQWASAPVSLRADQRCRELVLPATTAATPGLAPTCLWDRFPPVAYLNWPFVLGGQAMSKPAANAGEAWPESVELLEAWQDRPIAKSTFEVPAGWTLIAPR